MDAATLGAAIAIAKSIPNTAVGDSYKLLQRTDKYVKELRKEESK